MAKKTSTEYGKRYSLEEKQAIMREWREKLLKGEAQTKTKFAKAHHISPITLDKWLSSADAPPLVQITEEPQIVEIVSEASDAPRTESKDNVASLIRTIQQHQASIEELKNRLRRWVDSL